MPEDPKPQSQEDYAKQFQDRNIEQALFFIRQLMCHCVLFVPGSGGPQGPAIPEQAKALIYSQLLRIVKLYEPEKAS